MNQLSPAFVTFALSQKAHVPADAETRLAREAVAIAAEAASEFTYAAFVRAGSYDDDHEMLIALAAIRLAGEASK